MSNDAARKEKIVNDLKVFDGASMAATSEGVFWAVGYMGRVRSGLAKTSEDAISKIEKHRRKLMRQKARNA